MPHTTVVAKGHNSYVQLVHDDGHTEWVDFNNEAAAQEAATAIELGFTDASNVTLAQFFDRFMIFHSIPNLAKKTTSRYSHVFERDIRPILGEVPIAEIQPTTVESYMDALRKAGSSNRTIASSLNVLSATLGVACKWRYITSNPVDKIDILRVGNSHE